MKLLKGFITYKFVCIQIEALIINRFSKSLNVVCFNIFNSSFTRFFLLSKNLSNKNKKEIKLHQFYFVLYISLYLKCALLLSNLITKLIKKDKFHVKNLFFVNKFLIMFIKSNLFFITGCQVRVAGKLGGKMRKSKFQFKIGKPRIQSYGYKLDYALNYSFTKYGVFGVKVWYLYG